MERMILPWKFCREEIFENFFSNRKEILFEQHTDIGTRETVLHSTFIRELENTKKLFWNVIQTLPDYISL